MTATYSVLTSHICPNIDTFCLIFDAFAQTVMKPGCLCAEFPQRAVVKSEEFSIQLPCALCEFCEINDSGLFKREKSGLLFSWRFLQRTAIFPMSHFEKVFIIGLIFWPLTIDFPVYISKFCLHAYRFAKCLFLENSSRCVLSEILKKREIAKRLIDFLCANNGY